MAAGPSSTQDGAPAEAPADGAAVEYTGEPPTSWDLTPEPNEVTWGPPLASDPARRKRYREQLQRWLTKPLEPLAQRWRDRAKRELNEEPQRLQEGITALRKLVQEEPNLNSRLDDHFLLSFLRAKRHDVAPAFKSLIKYYRMRKLNPTFFELCLPSAHLELYKLNAVTLLDGYDILGRPVCYFSADFSPSSITNYQYIQLMVHLLDFLMIDPRMQISGITILVNLEKQTLGHARLITIKFLKLMLQIFQGSFPVRMKKIIICHGSFLFKTTFAVLKPFIPEKFKTRIHIMGGDLSTLQNYIPTTVLPPELKGESSKLRDDIMAERIALVEDWLTEWHTYGFEDGAALSHIPSMNFEDDDTPIPLSDAALQRRLEREGRKSATSIAKPNSR